MIRTIWQAFCQLNMEYLIHILFTNICAHYMQSNAENIQTIHIYEISHFISFSCGVGHSHTSRLRVCCTVLYASSIVCVCTQYARFCLLVAACCTTHKAPTYIIIIYDRRPRRYDTKCSRKFGTISEPNRFLLDARAILYIDIFFKLLQSWYSPLNFSFNFFMRRFEEPYQNQ